MNETPRIFSVHGVRYQVTDVARAAASRPSRPCAGPGGRQIQVEDPDGNPIELFEPLR